MCGSLNNDIDLHTEGMLGQDYEASTIAYRYYAKGQIPEDNGGKADYGNP